MRESIELDEDDARRAADVGLAAPCLELADQGAEERKVVAGRQHGGHEGIDDRKDHRTDERVHEAVDGDPADLGDEPERERLHEDRDDGRDGDRDARHVRDERRA